MGVRYRVIPNPKPEEPDALDVWAETIAGQPHLMARGKDGVAVQILCLMRNGKISRYQIQDSDVKDQMDIGPDGYVRFP